jgi:hypothetical protein
MRLVKLVIFLLLIFLAPLECVFYGIRWIILGKDFPNYPIVVRFMTSNT